MNLKIEIDSHSGFCNGVIRAINTAEENLGEKVLYSLGAIVHNSEEMGRLNSIGLKVIDIEQMRQMNNTSVLIRAHGEPPSTYDIARENNISLIDCTCPVVVKLQQRIRECYRQLKSGNIPAQIVIFGKEGHAEVNGLIGQVQQDAVIIDVLHNTGCNSVDSPTQPAISFKGLDKIDYSCLIYIFSQTTKDPKEYGIICSEIERRIAEKRGCSLSEAAGYMKVHNTICRQVAQRHTNLVNFASSHDVIIFVSGKESSNGKVLYDLCRSVNVRSYHIEQSPQIAREWFDEECSVGICGATSTPKWQLEEVARHLESFCR